MNTNELREEFEKFSLQLCNQVSRASLGEKMVRDKIFSFIEKTLSLALAKRDEEEREAVDKMLQFILESIPADEDSLNTRYGIREIKAINKERYNQKAFIRSLLNNKEI